MGNFGQGAKGGPFAKFSKLAILKGYKICNTSRILTSLILMHAEFILVFFDTKISMKPQELVEK